MHSNDLHRQLNLLKSELQDYRIQEEATWGGIDDHLLARYVSGECNDVEAKLVKEAAKKFPAVREAIDVIQDVLATPLDELVPKSPPVASTNERTLNVTHKRGAIPGTEGPLVRVASEQTVLKWSSAFSALLSSLAAVVAIVCLSQIVATRNDLAQLAARDKTRGSATDRNTSLIELQSHQSNHPGTLSEIWGRTFVESATDADNLRDLTAAMPASFKKRVDDLKKKGFKPEEIIAFFKITFALESDSK